MLVNRHALIDLLVHEFKLDLRRVLELFQSHTRPADYIDSLHESLHTLPHVGHWVLNLLFKWCGERDFFFAEELHDCGAPWWMLLHLHLLHAPIIRVGETES